MNVVEKIEKQMGITGNKEDTISARLIVSTQMFENYGAHDWDGEGECPQYWKAKFGYDYNVVPDWFDLENSEDSQFEFNVKLAVAKAREKIECDDDYFREYIIADQILPAGVYTEFEKSQLEYDGPLLCDYGPVKVEVSL